MPGQFNEILEGGLNQVIVKRLGMQVGTAVPAVQPEMAMDITLESDRTEWGYLKGEYRYTQVANIAAGGAGNHSFATLENPANSGVLVVVEEVLANTFTFVRLDTTLYTSLFTAAGRYVDGRQPQTSRAGLAFGNNVPTGTLPTAQWSLPTNVFDGVEWVLPPGARLHVWNTTAAAALIAQFAWRERPALPGELG